MGKEIIDPSMPAMNDPKNAYMFVVITNSVMSFSSSEVNEPNKLKNIIIINENPAHMNIAIFMYEISESCILASFPYISLKFLVSIVFLYYCPNE